MFRPIHLFKVGGDLKQLLLEGGVVEKRLRSTVLKWLNQLRSEICQWTRNAIFATMGVYFSIEWKITNFTIFGLCQEKSSSAQPGKNPSDAHVCRNCTDCHDLLFVKFATNREMLFKTTDIFKTCCRKFPFSSKLLRSVRALSVDLVSALSTRHFTWLLSFVCVLTVCGCQWVASNGSVYTSV